MKKIRKIEEIFFRSMALMSSILIIFALGLIIFSIIKKGFPALSWEMVSQTPKGGFYFGKEGGILNAIVGSLFLATGATFLALIIGLPVALYINVYLIKRVKLVNSIRFLLDVLWGVPSIVYGAFGFAVMIYFGLKTSLLAGIVVVTLFIIPIMVRAMDESLKLVPRGLLESASSLGATKTEIAFRVFLRQSFPALITATLLSFGRAIGDAAAVMFTAGFTDSIPQSLGQQSATLPLSIFFQLSSPIEEVKNRAYAAALVLTVIILIISILSRFLTKRFKKNIIKF